jgi:hypothetical protein
MIDLSKFNDKQIEQINKGIEQGVDVELYAHPEYHWTLMLELRVIQIFKIGRGNSIVNSVKIPAYGGN